MRYAGFWRRSGAHLIDFGLADLLFQLLVENIIFCAMYGVYFLIAHYQGAQVKPYDGAFDPLLEQIVSVIVGIAIVLPYYIWTPLRFGTHPGKKPFKVYVVRASDCGPMTLKQSTVRCFGYVLSYATLGCGFLMAAFHPQKRALHDLLAGTVCIVKED